MKIQILQYQLKLHLLPAPCKVRTLSLLLTLKVYDRSGFVRVSSVFDFLQFVSPVLNCWRYLHVLGSVAVTCGAVAWVLT